LGWSEVKEAVGERRGRRGGEFIILMNMRENDIFKKKTSVISNRDSCHTILILTTKEKPERTKKTFVFNYLKNFKKKEKKGSLSQSPRKGQTSIGQDSVLSSLTSQS